MRTLPTGTSTTGGTSQSGFTLIELMVVMVILVITSSVVAVCMIPALRDARMRSACRMIVSSLNYARSYAAAHNIESRVVFGEDSQIEIQTYEEQENQEPEWVALRTSAGRSYKLPENVQVTDIVKPDESATDNWITFTNTGTADEARIEVSNEAGVKRYITVDQITGRSQIRSEAEQKEYEESDAIEKVR